MDDRILKHRYTIAGSLIGVFLTLITTTIGYYYVGDISRDLASLVLAGLGAIGTVFLASVTLLTLLENRRELELELNKDTYKSVITDVINPAIDTIDRNQRKFENSSVNWGGFNEEGEIYEVPNIEEINVSKSTGGELFREEYSKVEEEIEEYNDILVKLQVLSHDILEDSRYALKEYIDARGLTGDYGRAVVPSKVCKLVLNGDRLNYGEDVVGPEWWNAGTRQELYQQVEKSSKENFDEFFETKQTFKVKQETVREELVGAKIEIERRYPIQINDE